MAMASIAHIPVMPQETLAILAPQAAQVAIDLTVGLGGHSMLLSEAVGPSGTIVGFDLDAGNLKSATERLHGAAKSIPVHARFTEAPGRLASLRLKADMVLADLGFSSSQMDDPARGFSFAADGPLDMRMDTRQGETAADLLEHLSERELADVIYRYGDDPYARRIAQKLEQIRRREPIRTTARLAEAVVEAYGSRARASRMHPATRTFMALRIAVNDELGSLRTLLDQISEGAEQVKRGGGRGEEGWLRHGARIAIISFHSLEDRLVKHAFADMSKRGLATRLTKKPMTATQEEVRVNPRARSAKLRGIRIDAAGSTTTARP
jgi:16S rRNA (cytosine1402-N4)-methyltransferase